MPFPFALVAITARPWSMTFTVGESGNATSVTTVSGWTCRYGVFVVRSAGLGGNGSIGWPDAVT